MSEMEIPESLTGSRRYPHAPIAEAVLELRVELPEQTDIEDLAAFASDASDYAVHKPFTEVIGTFNVDPTGVSTHTTHEVTGHVWHTTDERRHVQVRRDLFLYAQRAPYKDWEEFVGEAERLWLRFKSLAKPISLTRAGCRFVNRIDIPLPSVELSDYLLTTAQVPPNLPQVISGYLMHLELPEVRSSVRARIISTLLQAEVPDSTSLILDIDVWSDVSLDTTQEGFNDRVHALLGELRHAKNDVFEACITDRTRELFL